MINIFDSFTLPFKGIPWFKKIQRYFYKNINQESAGCIVFKNNKILLIRRGGVWNDWSFPKGVIEKGSVEENALRETYEEVGLKPKIVKQLTANKYTFYEDNIKKRINKTVYYFLAKSSSDQVVFDRNPDKEEADSFVEYKWIKPIEAVGLVKHDREKEIIEQAEIYLSK